MTIDPKSDQQSDLQSDLAADLVSGALTDSLAAIAEDAARLILPYWRADVAVQTKSDASPVTEADQKAEALILARLAALYPGVQTVAEEAVAADGLPASAEAWFWLIDPLDGTRGFVEGRDCFTVNIALIHGDAPVAGVVSAPATGTTWATGLSDGRAVALRRGFDTAQNGTARMWEAISVRARPADAVALLSHSMTPAQSDALAAQHGCGEWQGTDSSLKFCLIAEGGFDAYPRTGPTSEWDTAAGHAVLNAAGGRVLGADGEPLRYGKPRFLNGPFVALGGAG